MLIKLVYTPSLFKISLFLSTILFVSFGTFLGGNFISGVNIFSTKTAEAQSTDLTPEQEAKLRAELADIENQIKTQQGILTQKAGEGVSIQRDIDILNARIKQAQLKIRAKELSINKLGKDITVKTNTITALGTRIDRGRESLQQIIQRTREIDNYS